MVSRRLAFEGGWVVTGQVSSIFGLLASLRVLTEILPPAAFGEFTLGLTIAFFANQIIFGPVANGIARYYAIATQANQTSSYFSASHTLLLRSVFITTLLGLFVSAALWASGNARWAGIVVAATALAAASGYGGALSATLTAARRRALVACQQGIEPWFKLVCALGAAHVIGHTGASPLLGYALGHLVSALALRLILMRLMRNSASSGAPMDWSGQIWAYARPFLFFAFFTWANISSDRWALQHFAGPGEVGLYAAAFMLGYSPMATVSAVLVQLAAPVIYQANGQADPDRALKLAKRQCDLLAGAIVFATFVAWLIAACFHQQIFEVFIAKDYRSASALMPWMILAGGIFATGEASGVFLNSAMQTHLQIVPKIVTAVVGVALNVLAAHWLGSRGVVFSVLAFSILYFLWLRYIVWKTSALPAAIHQEEDACAVK